MFLLTLQAMPKLTGRCHFRLLSFYHIGRDGRCLLALGFCRSSIQEEQYARDFGDGQGATIEGATGDGDAAYDRQAEDVAV